MFFKLKVDRIILCIKSMVTQLYQILALLQNHWKHRLCVSVVITRLIQSRSALLQYLRKDIIAIIYTVYVPGEQVFMSSDQSNA